MHLFQRAQQPRLGQAVVGVQQPRRVLHGVAGGASGARRPKAAGAAWSRCAYAHALPPRLGTATPGICGAGVGCRMQTNYRRCRTAQMAAEGIRFTDFHVAASVCSVSRAALMTGQSTLAPSHANRVAP